MSLLSCEHLESLEESTFQSLFVDSEKVIINELKLKLLSNVKPEYLLLFSCLTLVQIF